MALKFHFTDFPPIIAHRGLSAYAPENTLESFALAAAHGLSWIETDVRLSRDHIPMLFHDAELERTSNGHGLFVDYDAATLAKLDAGSWFAAKFQDARIPTLDQLLDLALAQNLGLNLEIKANVDEDELTVEVVHQLLQRRQQNPAILFSSYSVPALKMCQQLRPRTPRALVVDNFELNTAQEIVALTESLGCTSLHINQQLIYTELIKLAYYAPFDLMCFTVNDELQAKACWGAGCASIFSDNGLFTQLSK
ncbi:MAG: hypothetical protein HWE13_12575 [Gammaproteobacteria bacterium]|nr:hypothetical protein [Gammaproteobacteria bacterium]NVK88961.1 hypothetical protein [Gammaproteobacteria bacterium]